MGAPFSSAEPVASLGCDGAKPSVLAPAEAEQLILLAPELFRIEGGIARISRLYLQGLALREPNRPLHVVVLNDEAIAPAALARHGAGAALAWACDRRKFALVRTLLKLTRGRRTHVVCTHLHLAVLLPLLRTVGRRLTYDVVVHGIEVWRPLSWWQRHALAGARLVLSVSEFSRSEIRRHHPTLPANLVVLPNALDPSFSTSPPAEPVPPPTATGVILTVSRLAPHDRTKGIDHLIAALPAVRTKHPAAHLRIVGDGADRNRLEALASASGARDHITFLGHVDDAALRRELAGCTVFALPSAKEGFGLVYLEAMAAGKPCVAASAGGAPEVVDASSGLLAPFGDPDRLAEVLIAALDRPWSAAAIRTRAETFSFAAFLRRWEALAHEA